jgi:hypothetical protein
MSIKIKIYFELFDKDSEQLTEDTGVSGGAVEGGVVGVIEGGEDVNLSQFSGKKRKKRKVSANSKSEQYKRNMGKVND